MCAPPKSSSLGPYQEGRWHTRAEFLVRVLGYHNPSVDDGLRLQDVLVVPVASGFLVGGPSGAGAAPPLVSLNLFKHGCLVKKGQVALEIKISVWDFVDVVPKALVVLALHLPVLQPTLLRGHLVRVAAAG